MNMERTMYGQHATKRTEWPAILALAAAALLVALLISWSTARTDAVSIQRQEELVSRVLDQSVVKLIREQESVTLKDNWVRFYQRHIASVTDIGALNGNQGPFLHRYFGHDESYLLNDSDVAFYAMRDGRRVQPRAFASVRAAATPLIAEVRAKTRAWGGRPVPGESPGAYDITVVNGHPVILSVKPVMSPTGLAARPPGREAVQISVLRLDGRFLRTLSENYLFRGARFSWSDDRRPNESVRPFVSRSTGRVIGYFVWQPFAPGSAVLTDIVPVLLLTLLLVGGVIWLLMRHIRRGTLQLQANEAQAKHLAFHDVLTGLPNRALFNDRLDSALATARRHPGRNAALLYLDLDRFKQVNDTLGHPAGDELIREMARRLSAVVRETDTVARLGGDEFAIIQTDVRSKTDTARLCQRILQTVHQPFHLVGSQMFVGVSIGVAVAPDDALDRVELTRKADIALYHAKSQGRGRHAIFRETMDATIQVRQRMEHDLRAALVAGNQFEVHYQPLFSAETKEVSGAEALVRWNHPTKGMMSPSTFIPIAEETRLIEPLGEWVLSQALAAAADWPIPTISVNISGVQLRNPLFAKRVREILGRTGFDPRRLELEITETSFVESAGECERNIDALREMGVRIALDDFGTGYSSFAHLRSFHVDRVKIDRSFVIGIESLAGSPIIQAIADLAKAAGMKITAEGVETDAQSEYLCLVGCDELQGFLLSRPIPRDQIDLMFGLVRKTGRGEAEISLAA